VKIFNYPVEKNIIRFYKYKLLGLESYPIVIEAYNKLEARQKMLYMIEKHPQLYGRAVISESLSLPIFGETTKTIDGIKHVWVGNVLDIDWLPLNEFEKLGYE
jgi:hypothetical protein